MAAAEERVSAKDRELAALKKLVAEQMEMLTHAMETISGLEAERATERMEEAKRVAAAEKEAKLAASAAEKLRTRTPTPTQIATQVSAPPISEQMLALQLQFFATNHVQSVRPKVKFGGSKKIDFAKHLKQFSAATETPGVTPQQKILEFQHYFEGAALHLIEADLLKKDLDVGYALAVSRLERKFGTRRETALEMMDELLQGKALPEKDANGLLEFYGKLAGVYEIAVQTNRAGEFETRATVETILKKKLPHFSAKWTERAIKCQLTNDRELSFLEFLNFINERHEFLDRFNRTMATPAHVSGASKAQGGGAKVAATTVAPAATTTKPAAKAAGCAACGATHSMADCAKFASMEAGAKRRACMSAGACFRCLETGHLAATCGAEMKCATCQRAHHSAAHELQRRDDAATGAKTPA